MTRFYITKQFIETNVSPRFDKKVGDINYHAGLDVNNDGIIDMKDIYWFAKRVGEVVDVPDPYNELIGAVVSAPFAYVWDWAGKTNRARFSWWTEDGRAGGIKLPPDYELIEKAKSVYYATVTAEFIRQLQAQGITATLIDVIPEVTIEKSDVRSRSYYVARGERLHTSYEQDIIVHVEGKVYFQSTEELMGSPIAPALVIAIGKAIAIIIGALLVGWGIMEFLKNMSTYRSEVEQKSTITLGEDTYFDKDVKLDDVVIPAGTTLPAGTVLEFTKKETTEKPPLETSIVMLLLGVALIAALSPRRRD